MAFCPNCGKEIQEEDQFCKSCGSKINSNGDLDIENLKEKNLESVNIDNKLLIIPLILGITGIAIGIIEGLGCPMLFGWINIMSELVIAIVGGCLGLYLYHFKKEYLISGIQFIITGIIMIILIGNMALIGCIVFLLAGILSIVLTKKYNVDNKVSLVLPVFTIILMFLLVVLFVGIADYNQSQLTKQVTISNVNNNIAYSYGYYDGYLRGDIHFDTSLDYVTMEVEFMDANGKILDSTYALLDSSVEADKTYQFEALYMKQDKPYTAQIILKNSPLNDVDPFYVQNVTLA